MTSEQLGPDNEIESGLWIENELRKKVLQEATVVNVEKGYIDIPSVNQLVDLEM